MWAIIPVRWTTTPPTDVFSDAEFRAWMDPTIRFSLGHFLYCCTFGQADLSYDVLRPVVMDNPLPVDANDIWNLMFPQLPKGAARITVRVGRPDRNLLVQSALDQATRDQQPDWFKYSQILLWYAQPTDLFAAGAVAVVSRTSSFDLIAHEALHALGFAHSYRGTAVYSHPYDAMSAATFGGFPVTYERPPVPGLPQVPQPAGATTIDVNAVIGPLLSPAHLMNHATYRTALEPTGLFAHIPNDLSTPFKVRLHAVDHAADVWPTLLGAVVAQQHDRDPHNVTDDNPNPSIFLPTPKHLYLELRRGRQAGDTRLDGYDDRFRASYDPAQADLPAAGVVIHQMRRIWDPGEIGMRLDFRGVLPIANSGDLDARVLDVDQAFNITITRVGPNNEWVDVRLSTRIAGDPLILDAALTEAPRPDLTTVEQIWVKPCFLAERGPHDLTLTVSELTHTVTATSHGYERPGYEWRINDQQLIAAAHPVAGLKGSGTLDLVVQADVPDMDDDGAFRPRPTTVHVTWSINVNVLTVTVDPLAVVLPGVPDQLVGNFTLSVDVTASETATAGGTGTTRTVSTVLRFDTLTGTWDASYRRARDRCGKALRDAFETEIDVYDVIPDPGDPFRGLVDVLDVVERVAPATADAIVTDLAVRTGMEKAFLRYSLRGGR